MGSRVELFEQIRRDSRVDGLSVRALAKRHRVHRRTVRQALISAQPPAPAPPRWQPRKIDPFAAAIDDMLRADRDAPRKQRHTARRILARLIDEHDAADMLSYSTLRDYVAKRRPEIAAETGDQLVEAFVPQTHGPGREAEVDFAELYVDLPEGRTKCFLFTMRLSMSGKAVHRVFATQSQEAFLEGHLAAFDEFGGIPTGHIRYDNLKSAVSRVLFGDRGRIENQRWVLFRSHQGFEAFYCIPGIAGAHEKGGVEGEGGRSRPSAIAGQTIRAQLRDLSVAAGATHADGSQLQLTPHDCRRAFATEHLNSNAPVHVIAALLGHAGLDTVMIYAKLYPDSLVEGYRAAMRGLYGNFYTADDLGDPDGDEWAAFTASCNLRDMGTHICALPTGEHCARGLVCLGCHHAQPKKSAAPTFRRMIASYTRALTRARETGEPAGQLAARELEIQRLRDALARADDLTPSRQRRPRNRRHVNPSRRPSRDRWLCGAMTPPRPGPHTNPNHH